MPSWTSESRLTTALGLVAEAIQHASLIAREAPHATQSADRALKLLEQAEQVLGRDTARDLSLPSYRYASAARVADRWASASDAGRLASKLSDQLLDAIRTAKALGIEAPLGVGRDVSAIQRTLTDALDDLNRKVIQPMSRGGDMPTSSRGLPASHWSW
jgi:hypothetical protein